MKRIITMSLVLFAGVVLLASCTKRDYYDDRNDQRDYWYGQERGMVKWSSDVCPYFIVDLGDTYGIMRALTSANDYPYPDDYIYGNFNSAGTRDYFFDNGSDNYSDGFVGRATLVEFEPNLDIAISVVRNQYCGGITAKANTTLRQRPNSLRATK